MPQHAPAQAAGAAGDPSLDALLASPLLKAALAPPPPPATGLIGAHRPGAPAGSGSSFTSAKGYAAWAAAASPTAADAAAQQAPAAAPRSRLLALCPTVPPAMQRSEWCLDDYQVLEKLYTGYASKGERRGRPRARPRESSRPGSRGATAGGAHGAPRRRAAAGPRARPRLHECGERSARKREQLPATARNRPLARLPTL